MVPAAFWRTVASGCGSRRLAAVLKHLAQRKVRVPDAAPAKRNRVRKSAKEFGLGCPSRPLVEARSSDGQIRPRCARRTGFLFAGSRSELTAGLPRADEG